MIIGNENGIQSIAAAVIHEAFKDIDSIKPQHRNSAVRFFTQSKWFDFYCDACGVNAEVVRQKATKKIELLSKDDSKNA